MATKNNSDILDVPISSHLGSMPKSCLEAQLPVWDSNKITLFCYAYGLDLLRLPWQWHVILDDLWPNLTMTSSSDIPTGGKAWQGLRPLEARLEQTCMRLHLGLYEALSKPVWGSVQVCMRLYPCLYEALSKPVWRFVHACMRLYPCLYEALSRPVWGSVQVCMRLYPCLYEAISMPVWGTVQVCMRLCLGLYEALFRVAWGSL